MFYGINQGFMGIFEGTEKILVAAAYPNPAFIWHPHCAYIRYSNSTIYLYHILAAMERLRSDLNTIFSTERLCTQCQELFLTDFQECQHIY